MTNNSDIHMDSLGHKAPVGATLSPSLVKRGFAAMDRTRQRDIASKGGSSVPVAKRSFSRDHELAVRAGRKGGLARMKAAQAARSFDGAERPSAPQGD
jgi:general stress protein YciG